MTAELTDSDGVVSGPTWQWYKQNDRQMLALMPSETMTAWRDRGVGNQDQGRDVSTATLRFLKTTSTWLLVTVAKYIDGYYDYDADATEMGFARTVDPSSYPAMVQGSSANMAPEFDGTRAMRYVPEDAASDRRNVGKPVVAEG